MYKRDEIINDAKKIIKTSTDQDTIDLCFEVIEYIGMVDALEVIKMSAWEKIREGIEEDKLINRNQ